MKHKEKSGMNTPGVFFMFLSLLFIGLKLTGYITWSWWLVLLPLLGPICLGIVLFMIIAAVAVWRGE